MPRVCPCQWLQTKKLVHNLRHVNLYLWKQKFKYEDTRTALDMVDVGDYMLFFNLKSGYHHNYTDSRGALVI